MNLILAAEYRHAILVAEYLGLERREWRYVSDPMQMYGYREPTIFVYDTFEWRRDFCELARNLERYEALTAGSVRIITEEML